MPRSRRPRGSTTCTPVACSTRQRLRGAVGQGAVELEPDLRLLRHVQSQLGNSGNINGLGQGAFQAGNGDVVVRKDWKVLLVDIKGLPAQFGVPPTPSDDVAVTVADVILGCWAGD